MTFFSTQVNVKHMKSGFSENFFYLIKLLKKILWEFRVKYNQTKKSHIDVMTQRSFQCVNTQRVLTFIFLEGCSISHFTFIIPKKEVQHIPCKIFHII